jgi:cytochrome c-type biogenesis protein CcmH
MEASSGTTQTGGASCGECTTLNLTGANFCKACGAAMAPPPKCPKCEADIDRDAKFCGQCGTKLVGVRPAQPKNGAHKTEAPKEKKAKKDVLAAEKANLPPPKKPSSNISTNVVLFAALILGMGTVIYAVGKGQQKEASPFSGGPPPAMTATPPASPPPGGAAEEAVPAGDPIRGEISLDASLGSEGSGTIFIILRNAGMPNQGPPLAVKKIENPKFPVAFEVSQADIMMPGIPFAGPFDIYVRLDRDGNAMTKDAGDLMSSAPAAGIKAGATGVAIKLDKKL